MPCALGDDDRGVVADGGGEASGVVWRGHGVSGPLHDQDGAGDAAGDLSELLPPGHLGGGTRRSTNFRARSENHTESRTYGECPAPSATTTEALSPMAAARPAVLSGGVTASAVPCTIRTGQVTRPATCRNSSTPGMSAAAAICRTSMSVSEPHSTPSSEALLEWGSGKTTSKNVCRNDGW